MLTYFIMLRFFYPRDRSTSTKSDGSWFRVGLILALLESCRLGHDPTLLLMALMILRVTRDLGIRSLLRLSYPQQFFFFGIIMSHDTWRPSAAISTLQRRAEILQSIRTFFVSRGYLEVETPVMAQFGITDVYLSNVKAVFREKSYCLQTSPEYHMKRLLAAGSGPIFQLARVFRDDELGRWHNPEFTLLEWYQLNIDHHGLMDEMEQFLQTVLGCGRLIKKTYRQAFLEACDLDPFQYDIPQARLLLTEYGLDNVLPENEKDWDQYLFLLMSHVVEPFLGKEQNPVAVYDFPISQAALAKVNQGVAERFEVYFKGIELANGFHELVDANSQRLRFQQDNSLRQQRGLPLMKMDEFLLQALEHGLPNCSGVALGIDRLLALVLNAKSISETLSFDFSRA